MSAVLVRGQPRNSGGLSGNVRLGSPSERCPIAADSFAAITAIPCCYNGNQPRRMTRFATGPPSRDFRSDVLGGHLYLIVKFATLLAAKNRPRKWIMPASRKAAAHPITVSTLPNEIDVFRIERGLSLEG
jgi:hypothetical protein